MAAAADPLNPPPNKYSAATTFDSIGPAYEAAFANLPEQLASLRWLLTHLPPSSKILDIGCGTGRPVCSTLADAGHSVLGIDISSAMISAARERVPNAAFALRDLRTFEPDEAGGVFDAVTVYFSLIAGVSRAEIHDAFTQVHGWLKPEGLFVFATVPDEGGEGENVAARFMGREVVASSLTAEESVAGIRGVGFEVLYEMVSRFTPRAVEAGICGEEDVEEEEQLFVYAKKKG